MKVSGNLSLLRFTASLRRRVSTPYNAAKSASSLLPSDLGMTWMRQSRQGGIQ